MISYVASPEMSENCHFQLKVSDLEKVQNKHCHLQCLSHVSLSSEVRGLKIRPEMQNVEKINNRHLNGSRQCKAFLYRVMALYL